VPRANAQSFGRKLVADPLAGAFVISLMLHFAGIAGVELGRHLGWWERSLFTALIKPKVLNEVIKTAEQRAELQRQLLQQRPPPEAELVFVDVDPEQAALEPPKDAKYYSSHNTLASNRAKDDENKNLPKIDGKQENVPKTMDTIRPDPRALQPYPPPEKEHSKPEVMQPAPQPVKPVQPAPAPAPVQPKKAEPTEKGETLLAKVTPREPTPAPQPNNPPPEEPKRRRPASLAEARAQKGILEGPKMRQHGGARLGPTDGLDVKATPFGTYDALFIEAVQSRWFSLLDERNFVGNQAGKVMVEFRLHQDGRITDLSVVDSTVNELLSWFCQRAILDPAPYRPFPTDLRRMMSTDYREIRFTFYYNQ